MGITNTHWGESQEQSTASLNDGSTRPVIFLDVDGVINSFPMPTREQIEQHGKYEFADIITYPIWWSPKVVDFLNEVNRSGAAEIVWLTTWREEAATELAPVVGLDEFPVITDGEGDNRCWLTGWWKWRRVRDFLGDNNPQRPVIWIDDDLGPNIKDEFYYRYDENQSASLLITPKTQPGLVQSHLDEITEFLAGFN